VRLNQSLPCQLGVYRTGGRIARVCPLRARVALDSKSEGSQPKEPVTRGGPVGAVLTALDRFAPAQGMTRRSNKQNRNPPQTLPRHRAISSKRGFYERELAFQHRDVRESEAGMSMLHQIHRSRVRA
jgi:hypothetical protein